jgi:hypothetical protein
VTDRVAAATAGVPYQQAVGEEAAAVGIDGNEAGAIGLGTEAGLFGRTVHVDAMQNDHQWQRLVGEAGGRPMDETATAAITDVDLSPEIHASGRGG